MNHTGMCDICGKQRASDEHHLVYNTANRRLSDADNLTLKICKGCHNEIHLGKNGTAGHLSKMLGQALFELSIYEEESETDARLMFIKRYGKSKL